MDITVVGLGYVGSVASVGLSAQGHDVHGVDINRARVNSLACGNVPFYEPKIECMLREQLGRGSLRFSCVDDSFDFRGNLAMICVGTPQLPNGEADLRQVQSAISWIKAKAPEDTIILMKSTVPPGTGESLITRHVPQTMRYIANPEFLREGQAIHDWMNPDRVVMGAHENHRQWVKRMAKVLFHNTESSNCKILVTGVTSAEMIKYASNAFLATRISFMNEIALLCERVGASVDEVSTGLSLDSRTGSKIYPGIGYGGSCFPKDTRALDRLGLLYGVDMDVLRSVIVVNQRQRLLPLLSLRERFAGLADRPVVAVLGLSFKPGTDDVRESPGIDLAHAFTSEGWKVNVYDPVALDAAVEYLPPAACRTDSIAGACEGAHAAVVATEWAEIIQADWKQLAQTMRKPRYIFDGRNALSPDLMRDLGFEYKGVGYSNYQS